ncbi:hypothetical protein [Nocardia sp. CA-145437]|uniref:hypothetical protein n=1 Tax=Nocardia sp. CA-145437 TaxID=3239980 RepID=UPI003D9861FA
MSGDGPAAERYEVDLETLLLVFLDGMHTGAATVIARFARTMSGDEADLAAAAILAPINDDPLALEELRAHVLRRLTGDIPPDTTEVRVYGSE